MYFYTLSDPRTNLVRYVGKTASPKIRQNGHTNPSKNRKDKKTEWVNELASVGIIPTMTVIYEVACSKRESAEIESYWIYHYVNLGYDLLNGVLPTGKLVTKLPIPTGIDEEAFTDRMFIRLSQGLKDRVKSTMRGSELSKFLRACLEEEVIRREQKKSA